MSISTRFCCLLNFEKNHIAKEKRTFFLRLWLYITISTIPQFIVIQFASFSCDIIKKNDCVAMDIVSQRSFYVQNDIYCQCL